MCLTPLPPTIPHLNHPTPQGKKSIILDAKKPAAREVIRKAVEAADVVLLNKMDNQLVGLGLNRETYAV